MADSQESRLKVRVRTRPSRSRYVNLTCDGFKTRTKAKKRYLKAKRERRKQRKNSALSAVLPEEETGDNPGDGSPEKTPTMIDLAQLPEQSGSAAEGDFQKKKKRKLDHSTAKGTSFDKQPQPVEVDEPKFVDEPELNRALPLFPLPTHPNAPSKAELALQGLDRAQVEAEFVDLSSTFSISLDTDGSQSILSLKTRKRLIDLGVNDLFAGISHPFPR